MTSPAARYLRFLTEPSSTSLLFDHVISPFYDRLVVLWPRWVPPNAITLLGGVCCTLSVVAMRRSLWGCATLAFTLYHALDNMDGKHARRTKQTSRVGKVLDHAIDGTVGITASTQICCECLFEYPAALEFALGCGMVSMLACHAAELRSGTPTLGVRLFSADELFLLCSAALGWRALLGRPMLSIDMLGLGLQRCIKPCWVVGVACGSASVVRRPPWLAGLAAFGAVCAAFPLPVAVALYLPAFGWLLVFNARRCGVATADGGKD